MTTTGYRLGPRVRRCIAIGCWFGAALSLAIGPILALTDLFRDKSGCSRDTIGTFASPDDNWVAFVQEEICSDGAFTTTVDDYVQLAQRGPEPTHENDIFAVEEHGHTDNRPVLLWQSSHKLQITVPNKSLIGLRKHSYHGIDVVVRFDHDDPTGGPGT
jgi:hypothetical protein